MKKLYVGNLPFSVTDDGLRDLFSQAGNVLSARVILDRDSGRSKGFGFVEMSSPEEADEAIRQINGSNFGGRSVTVNEAKPLPPRGEGPRGFQRGRGRPQRN